MRRLDSKRVKLGGKKNLNSYRKGNSSFDNLSHFSPTEEIVFKTYLLTTLIIIFLLIFIFPILKMLQFVIFFTLWVKFKPLKVVRNN